ncbi:tubulin delta chain-like isoform X1 [Engraulis encrasicolus]|uniref:tubulin delta chain-like isoform X1 n=1 Tax=Engraulis encrasicolus TaxID=184585 RepID=UPI002FCE9B5E
MSAVILQVGQCGNQLGLEWCELLCKTSKQVAHRSPFITKEDTLAVVCVDSESKVLKRAHRLVKNKKLLESNVVQGKGGRGNNWAYGYHGPRGAEGDKLLHGAMEAVRREAEKRDYYGGTVMVHGVSGGTGSGLGSRLCEEIRAEYPVSHLLSVSVVPHQSGESPLQHYNTLLSLDALHRCCDGILLFHNDHALSGVHQNKAVCTSGLSSGVSQDTLSFMNRHIVSCMAGLLFPVNSLTTASGLSLGMEPWELIRSVCPMPSAKLLSITQASSREKQKWDRLAGLTLQSVPQLSPAGKSYTSRAVLAVARGDQDKSFATSRALYKLKRGHRCVAWNPFPIDHWTDPCNEMTGSSSGAAQLLTVCSNHSSVTSLLDHTLRRSKEKMDVRAYLHWYERYGVETQDFQQAMDTLLNVMEEYDAQ